jgi:predicted nuclease of predicted toxin-antitoxin system
VKILVDMNLSPAWTFYLNAAGHEALHWSEVGSPTAADETIFSWARNLGYIVFTHDLDFGSILAASQSQAPSVLQIRTQCILPGESGALILAILKRYEDTLVNGALVTIDERRTRVRILPLNRTP